MYALLSNTTGYSNTASGAYALYFNTTGAQNAAYGFQAGYNNTTGSSNTAIGYLAGGSNSSGSYNTFLGYSANVSVDGLTNATAIGYGAQVGESNALVLGSAGVSVGIGTTTPGYALDVVGDINASGCVVATGIPIGGTCSSDARLKTNIQPFAHVLDKVGRLQPVHFNWNAANPAGYRFGPGQSVGLIAQQVEKVFPDMVSTDARGYKRVNYSELPYLVLEGLRELKMQNDSLRAQVLKGQAEFARSQQAVAEKDAQVAKLSKEVEELRRAAGQWKALEARLARLESQTSITHTARSHTASKTGKAARTEIARVGF